MAQGGLTGCPFSTELPSPEDISKGCENLSDQVPPKLQTRKTH